MSTTFTLDTATSRAHPVPEPIRRLMGDTAPPAYVLYLEDAAADDGQLCRAGELVELQLRDNFHYAYCRDLGQLAAVRVFRIAGQGGEGYLQGCVAQGQRLGDVKPRSLHRLSGWTARFTGRMLG